jgi:hypothetical protein
MDTLCPIKLGYFTRNRLEPDAGKMDDTAISSI